MIKEVENCANSFENYYAYDEFYNPCQNLSSISNRCSYSDELSVDKMIENDCSPSGSSYSSFVEHGNYFNNKENNFGEEDDKSNNLSMHLHVFSTFDSTYSTLNNSFNICLSESQHHYTDNYSNSFCTSDNASMLDNNSKDCMHSLDTSEDVREGCRFSENDYYPSRTLPQDKGYGMRESSTFSGPNENCIEMQEEIENSNFLEGMDKEEDIEEVQPLNGNKETSIFKEHKEESKSSQREDPDKVTMEESKSLTSWELVKAKYLIEYYYPSIENVINNRYFIMRAKKLKNELNLNYKCRSNSLDVDIKSFWLDNRIETIGIHAAAEKDLVKFHFPKKKGYSSSSSSCCSFVDNDICSDFVIRYSDIIVCLMEVLDENSTTSLENKKCNMNVYFLLKNEPDNRRGCCKSKRFNNYVQPGRTFGSLIEELVENTCIIKVSSSTNYHANVYHFECLLSKAVDWNIKQTGSGSKELDESVFSKAKLLDKYPALQGKMTDEHYLLSSPFIKNFDNNLPFKCYRRYVSDENLFLSDDQINEIMENICLMKGRKYKNN